MKILVFLLAISLFGCYVSKVNIALDADNASALEIIAHSPTDAPDLGLDKKLAAIQKKLSAKSIPFGYRKETETIPVSGSKTVQHFKYPIMVKLSSSEKAELFSQIVADEMKISLDDFWYKVSKPEDSDQEKRWHLSLAFKPQARPMNVPENFQLTVKMPEKVDSYSHVPDKVNLKSKKEGKVVVYDYKRMNTNALYKFEVSAVRKKPVPPQPPATSVVIENNPSVNTNVTVATPPSTMAAQETKPKEPLPEPWFNDTVKNIAALLTAIAALIGAWAAFRPRKDKTD